MVQLGKQASIEPVTIAWTNTDDMEANPFWKRLVLPKHSLPVDSLKIVTNVACDAVAFGLEVLCEPPVDEKPRNEQFQELK